MDGEYATNDNLNVKIDIYWQTHFADSAQAEYCPTFRCVCVRPSVYRRDISYFSNNVYLGMYTIWACMPYESSEYPSNQENQFILDSTAVLIFVVKLVELTNICQFNQYNNKY